MEFFQALTKLTGKKINQHNVGLFVDNGTLKPVCTEFRNLKFYHYQGIYFRCIGCGNCVAKCPSEAINLHKRERQFIPFPTMDALFDKIMERKLALEKQSKN